MAAAITTRILFSSKLFHQSRIQLLKNLQAAQRINRNLQLFSFTRCISRGFLCHPACGTAEASASIRLFSDKVRQDESKIETTDEEDELYKWIEIRVKGHDESVLDSYEMFVSMAAKELEITLDSIMKPRKHIKRLSLLKSPFIHKKHFVQYEMRTHYRVMLFKHLTGSTASIFLEYVQRNLPEGVAMKITKCTVERMPEYIKADADMDQLVTGLDNVKV
ncbi:28S ribosomal protein S10, mitochondrial-like isoform X2 [Anneissia japonica]|uniref:28S ribosomal protein S10, mitochondrial-like isoform X2 n=1 Tax=Anneissia japonica TaxID=1529436 RepID=UPI0014258742|nr:28S ribosomal protein S10, mitochondrial-like isoform X2 [Anneissia japonica]